MFLAEAGRGQELGPPPRADERDFVPVAIWQQKELTVDTSDRSSVAEFYQTVYRASQGAASGWTGNRSTCTAGTTSQAYADATILRVNYFRAMTGLPGDVILSNAWNLKAQDAALMMSAQGQLSHSPDTSWKCYTAAGAEAAGKSNLALGADAAAAIDLYMDDPGAGGNAAVGHRRWILYPPTKIMGTGNIPNTGGWAANDLWVIGRAGSRPAQPAWVAWPPKGFVPYQVMPRSSGRWSFSYPGASFANAAVFMQRLGTNVSLTLETQAPGYGDNTIVWVPQGVPATAPTGDVIYTVTVSNVVISSQARLFTYSVTIIDPDVPALAAGRGPTNSIALSWSASSSGYTLQQNSSLADSGGWTRAGVNTQVVSNRYVAIVTNGPGRMFFRLRK
ncbi:MAG TPA: CAP domain-containing protein [Verrucomicrobiae bacterium]